MIRYFFEDSRIAYISYCRWCSSDLYLRFTSAMHFFLLRPLILFSLFYSFVTAQSQDQESAVHNFFQKDSGQGHTNNWAVLVCSSRYWFNYRVRVSSNVRGNCSTDNKYVAYGQYPRHVSIQARLRMTTDNVQKVPHGEAFGHSGFKYHRYAGR